MEKPTQPSLFGLEDEIGIVRESIQVLYKKVNEDKQDAEVTAKIVGTLSRTAVDLARLLKTHREMGLEKEDVESAMRDMIRKLRENYRQRAAAERARDEANEGGSS